jgi:hypothetical protein
MTRQSVALNYVAAARARFGPRGLSSMGVFSGSPSRLPIVDDACQAGLHLNVLRLYIAERDQWWHVLFCPLQRAGGVGATSLDKIREA